EPKGVGALQLAFEQLKARLAAEGLFDQARKRPLPFLPRRIGVVTSPTGAAVRDIVQVTQKRDPGVTIVVNHVAVQRESSAAGICARAWRPSGAASSIRPRSWRAPCSVVTNWKCACAWRR